MSIPDINFFTFISDLFTNKSLVMRGGSTNCLMIIEIKRRRKNI